MMLDLSNLLLDCGETSTAVVCLKRLTEKEPGNANAWQNLAVAYFHSDQFEEGIAASQQALRCDPSHLMAMHNLAVLSAGNGQNAPDYDTASKWFGAASAFGLADSQFNLAVLYENGLGVTKDPALAYSWYAIAARNGDAEATRRRDKLLGTLDVTTLQSADERVRNYHSRPIDQKINDARVAGDQWRSQTAQVQGQ